MAANVLVSACLLGLATRYDDSHRRSEEIIAYLRAGNLTPIPVCPEQLAGLPTPRCKTWFTEGDGDAVLDGRGRMVNEDGVEMTETFLRGARMSLQLARLTACEEAILKQRSPSCGYGTVYCRAQRVPGRGVTAALLARHGIRILTEEDF